MAEASRDDMFVNTSDVLLRLVREFPGQRITMGDIVAGVEDRAFGLLMLMFVLPNCLPMPGIPFVSTVTGTPVVFFAGQLALGRHTPWLPDWLLRQSIDRARLLRALERIAPYVRRLEARLEHRWPHLVTGSGERAAAAMALVQAVILALPIAFANLFPAWTIMVLAFGITERDGVCVAIGWVVGILSLAWVALVLTIGIKSLQYLITHALAVA
jgi:hypothetical protein